MEHFHFYCHHRIFGNIHTIRGSNHVAVVQARIYIHQPLKSGGPQAIPGDEVYGKCSGDWLPMGG